MIIDDHFLNDQGLILRKNDYDRLDFAFINAIHELFKTHVDQANFKSIRPN